MRKLQWVLLSLLSSMLVVAFAATSNPAASPPVTPSPSAPASGSSLAVHKIFLPVISQPDPFAYRTSAIWTHEPPINNQEVAFFRKAFMLDKSFSEIQISIFADTRYELWVDGTWIGRGPARFSQRIHEYDLYNLNTLGPGQHLIAVLVQWAPNNRRSESLTPYLELMVRGKSQSGYRDLLQTDSSWKARQAQAWQTASTPVHLWGLIGPTELVDLRRLPADWMNPEYDDSDWQAAVVKDSLELDYQPLSISSASLPTVNSLEKGAALSLPASIVTHLQAVRYAPRSIPVLTYTAHTPQVIESGLLSPGMDLIEVSQPITESYVLGFQAPQAVTVTIETLSQFTAPVTGTFLLDNFPLSWQIASPFRPDVYSAVAAVAPGEHQLQLGNIPTDGLSFSLSRKGITYTDGQAPTLRQGTNAGKRLLLAEPIPDFSAVTVQMGDTLSATASTVPAYLVLDLGKTVYGRIAAKVSGPAGSIVDIGWDERLLSGTNRPLPYPGSLHPYWDQVDSWILGDSAREITTIDARSGRYILVAIWGEGPVRLEDIRVYEEQYPVAQTGEFLSSSDLLNKIWQVGADTVRLNMNDAYADPWRERGQWWGDAYVIDHANRAAFGDSQLLRRGIEFMLDAVDMNGRPRALAPNGEGSYMLDYGMLSVQSLQEYGQITGDLNLAQDQYAAVLRFMQYLQGFTNAATGLLDIPFAHWNLTAYIDPRAYSSRYGQSTALNALYYETLLKSASIAEDLGDTSRSTTWRKRAARIKQQINTVLFDEKEGLYWTTIYEGEKLSPSPHAQAWALASGIVPPEQEAAVASALEELLSTDPATPNVDIYGMYWVLEALGRTGRIADALQIIERYYGYLLDSGATTWWERFDANQDYKASLSHGWGSSPTWFLTTYILGASQSGPTAWLVKPAFAGVASAEGALPLPAGLLQVSWQQTSCDEAHLNLVSPVGTIGEVVIPWVNASSLELDGSIIWEDGAALRQDVHLQQDGIHVPIGAGTYEMLARRSCVAR